ncbi:cytochrome c [Gammaproteobacteria bacterium]|nr:cytochrome c [Gammaproteobacteria bacterium]
MKKIVLSAFICSLGFIAQAESGIDMELAAKYACTACHTLDEPLIGPAYNLVYEKYKDDPNVEEYLFEKIKNGGSGVWGDMPMTPNPQVPDEDLHKLVAEILGR